MGISTGAIFLFVMFVLARNGWELSASEFPAQVAFAFLGGDREFLPKEVDEIETTIVSQRLLSRSGKNSLLLVTGEVFNNDVVQRSNVVLRGRLIDGTGEIRQELRFPCDKSFDERQLQAVKAGQVPMLYNIGGKMKDCTISPESASLYQLVLDGVPTDYNDSFKVEVKPVFAR